MSYAQALKPTIVNGLIAATITLFTLAMIAWTAPDARATPTIAKGQPCSACHSSSRPSKSDLKK